MSHLFEHNGADGRGYSQPEPVAPVDNIQIPSNLVRRILQGGQDSRNQKWFAITHGCQQETLESIQDFIHLVLAQ